MTAPTRGFLHQAGFYDGEAGLLPLVVPFVEAGLAAGEPAVIALGGPHAEMAREALAPTSGVTFLSEAYGRPAAVVAVLLDALRAHAHNSSGRLRVVGELPAGSLSRAAWSPWARYEAAVNHLFAPFDATTMCAYDTAATPAEILADVAATHPRVADDGGPNSHYQDPSTFLRTRNAPADPLQSTSPDVELTDPDPAAARSAVRDVAPRGAIAAEVVEDLVLGVSEAVANAHLHGRPPVLLRVWARPDRMLAVVSDTGPGPASPFAGLVPLELGTGGRGLWITHRICGQVDHLADGTGFSIRLATSPPPS